MSISSENIGVPQSGHEAEAIGPTGPIVAIPPESRRLIDGQLAQSVKPGASFTMRATRDGVERLQSFANDQRDAAVERAYALCQEGWDGHSFAEIGHDCVETVASATDSPGIDLASPPAVAAQDQDGHEYVVEGRTDASSSSEKNPRGSRQCIIGDFMPNGTLNPFHFVAGKGPHECDKKYDRSRILPEEEKRVNRAEYLASIIAFLAVRGVGPGMAFDLAWNRNGEKGKERFEESRWDEALERIARLNVDGFELCVDREEPEGGWEDDHHPTIPMPPGMSYDPVTRKLTQAAIAPVAAGPMAVNAAIAVPMPVPKAAPAQAERIPAVIPQVKYDGLTSARLAIRCALTRQPLSDSDARNLDDINWLEACGMASGEELEGLFRWAKKHKKKHPEYGKLIQQAIAEMMGGVAQTDLTTTDSEYHLATKCIDEYRMEPMRFLCEPHIPLGELVMIAGKGGSGKSQLALSIAADLGRGKPCLGSTVHTEPIDPIHTIFIPAEDKPETSIGPRFLAAGGDMKTLHIENGIRDKQGNIIPFSMAYIGGIESAIVKHREAGRNVRLVIIDPITTYMGKADTYKDSEVKATLRPLTEMAHRLDVTFIGLMHLNKGKGTSASDKTMGSTAFINTPRVAYLYAGDSAEGKKDYRILAQIKHNLPFAPPSVSVRLDRIDQADGVQMLGPYAVGLSEKDLQKLGSQLSRLHFEASDQDNADDVLAAEAEKKPGKPGPKPTATLAILKLIEERFFDQPTTTTDLICAVGNAGLLGNPKPDGKWNPTSFYNAIKSINREIPAPPAPFDTWKHKAEGHKPTKHTFYREDDCPPALANDRP